jgi:hypothetical protein
MNLNREQINEILSDLEGIRRGNNRVEKIVEKEIEYNYAQQGEEDLVYEVYKTADPKTFVKLEIRTDSYGENERITSIQFVGKVSKTISVYE